MLSVARCYTAMLSSMLYRYAECRSKCGILLSVAIKSSIPCHYAECSNKAQHAYYYAKCSNKVQ